MNFQAGFVVIKLILYLSGTNFRAEFSFVLIANSHASNSFILNLLRFFAREVILLIPSCRWSQRMTTTGKDHLFTTVANISLGGVVLFMHLRKNNISLLRRFDFLSFRGLGSARYSLLYNNEGFSVREHPISILFLTEYSLASSYPAKCVFQCGCHWSYPLPLHASANLRGWLVSADGDINSSFFHSRVIFKISILQQLLTRIMNRSPQEDEQERVSEEGLDDIVNPFEGSHRRMTSKTALQNIQQPSERQMEDKSYSSIESNSMKSRSKNSQEVPEQDEENNQSYRFDQSGVMLTQQDDDDLDEEGAEKLLLADEPDMKLAPQKSLIITPTPEREKSNKSSKTKDSQDLEISDKAYSSPLKRELTKEIKEENEIEFQPFRRNFAQKVQEEGSFNKLFSQANPTIADSSQDFNQSTQFEDEHDTMLRSNAIDIAEIDTQDLELQELNIERLNKQAAKTRFQKQRKLQNDIEKTHLLTNTKLQKRKNDLEKVLEQKELNSVMYHSKKEEVLRSNFSDAVRRLINNVKFQKESILSSYGPLVLQGKKKESSIFDVYDLKDSKQSKAYRDLLKLKNKIPQPIQVKIVTARCLKDKVGSGSYIVKCSVMDRLGGSKIRYDLAEYEDTIRSVSQNLREHNRKKRAFINREHRDLEHKTVGGRKVFLAAPKTGANWYKAGQANQGFDIFNQGKNQMKDIEEEEEDRDQQSQQQEQRINPEKDVKLEFTRIHSRFLRFDARYSDNDLFVNDEVNILIPPSPETSNILLFELILLASDTVPKDYVVGWGVFPLLNSEFGLNEGKFKTPLLFGNINKSFDKFERIEQQFKQDLDNWLCNLYIEMEKIQMSDIKVDVETKELYFSPLSKKKALPSDRGSHQRSIKNSMQGSLSDKKEDDQSVSSIYDKTSIKKFKSPALNLDEDASSSGSQDEAEEKKQISQRQSVISGLVQQSSVHLPSARLSKSPSEAILANEAVFQGKKTDEDIQFDQYQFSVCQKLDHRTKRLTFKKANYIMDEVLADLRLKKFKSIEFHLAWVYIFFLFYLRIFTHYIGQYIILNAMGVPVTRFEPYWYKIKVEYAPWKFIQDLLVVGAGLVMNIIVFVFLALVAFFVKRIFNWFPRIFFQVICWNGIMTILNPFLVLLFDLFSKVSTTDSGRQCLHAYRAGPMAITSSFTTTSTKREETAQQAST